MVDALQVEDAYERASALVADLDEYTEPNQDRLLEQAIEIRQVLELARSGGVQGGDPGAYRARFSVKGKPAPKGSRVFLGRGRSRESSDACPAWVDTVAYTARVHRPAGRTLVPPYSIELAFAMPTPAKPKYRWPTRDGDLDKLERAVLDGMVKGGLLVDDRHVTKLTSEKAFGLPAGVGVLVTVR